MTAPNAEANERALDLVDEVRDYCVPLCVPENTREAQAADYALQLCDALAASVADQQAMREALDVAPIVFAEAIRLAGDGHDLAALATLNEWLAVLARVPAGQEEE